MTETAEEIIATAAATLEPQKDEALASKHGFIDLDKIEDPEVRQQVQDRLSGLYRSNKDNTVAYQEMQRLYSRMEKKLSDLEAAKQKEAADTKLADVKKGIADAQAKGEYERAAELTETLTDLKAPKPEPPRQENDRLAPEQERALFAWQAEMTDDGRIKRPWANPGHSKYRETIAELTKASADPAIASQGFEAILQTVNERMAPKPKQTTPVADSDTTPPRQSGKQVKLTPQQERVARKMYPHEKDPIAAYSKAYKQYGAQ